MTLEEAKQYLRAYRPGLREDPAWKDDTRLAHALERVESDPELRAWWDEHCAFDRTVRRQFRDILFPRDGMARLLARGVPGSERVVPTRWGRRRVLGLAAAAILMGLAVVVFRPGLLRDSDPTFATYRARMVGHALRDYPMSVFTNAMPAIRSHLRNQNAPAAFHEPEGLAALTHTGAGVLGWRTNSVSMVCYDRGDQQMLFLFVVLREAVPDSPTWPPQSMVENRLQTLSWTAHQWLYLLAGPLDDPLAERLLSP